MPKTLLLHIGTTKTGTTSIQAALAGSRRAIAPVCYPRSFGDINHNRLVMLYLAGDQVPGYLQDSYHGRLGKIKLGWYRRHIFGQLSSAGDAIVSGEQLSSTLSAEAARKLRSDLELVGFQRFHVILYIRDPADFFLSATQQRLKSPTSQPGLIGFDAASFKYEFRRMVETWQEVFPGEVIVRKFPGTSEGDVVSDFSALMQELLGVSLPAVMVRRNTTISAEAMQILQSYRSTFRVTNESGLTPDVRRLLRYLESSSADIDQSKPVLKKRVVESIHARHTSDADFIFSRYGVDLGLPEVNPDPELDPSRTQRIDDLLETLDTDVVHQLLLGFAHSITAKTSKRSMPLRIAARIARTVRSQ
jgi:hypothetical protein